MMSISKISPKSLAEQILKHIGAKETYPDIPKNGAEKAAQAIVKILGQVSTNDTHA